MTGHYDRKDKLTTVAIAATFVAEPIEQPLAFWLQELGMPSQIAFASYNQVFQELLDPSSLFAINHPGINVILARLEDWGNGETLAEADAARASDFSRNIEHNVRDLQRALTQATKRFSTPHLVFLCPTSPTTARHEDRAFFCKQMEELLVSAMAGVNGVYVVTSQELAATYPVAEYYDQYGDELAHIPFTPVFFTALGTMIARQIFALNSPHPKVIVLDCDQTLWGGVCGEDGALGVLMDPARMAIQQFMVRQHDAGMLLCLCSKNNEEDVFEVFERRPEMALKREHIVSWRINWRPKSENIKSLAQELNLGLDSFIFMDDNPVECAEVKANCPEVLALRLPEDPAVSARFLKHLWVLDHLKVTDEAKERTTLYKQNLQRDRSRNENLTFKDFLAGLGLKVEISALTTDEIPRVAELTQRTNQFNFTTIRRSEAEIRELCRPGGAECLVVHAKDRFGDYGLVGAIIFAVSAGSLRTDTFLLSCRALGKGVEHQMLAKLGEIARERGLDRIDALYFETQKNKPALDFLKGIGVAFKQPLGGDSVFGLPVELTLSVSFNPQVSEQATESHGDQQAAVLDSGSSVANPRAEAGLLISIAKEMYAAERIHEVIVAEMRTRPTLETPFVAPRVPLEEKVAAIYSEVLGVERVGVHDNFFDLGGHSLLAMQVLSRIREAFQVEIPIGVLFTGEFSVAELVKTVGKNQIEQADPAHLDAVLKQLDELSDEQVKGLLSSLDLPGERKFE